MSSLVDHARKELEIAGVEPDEIDWYLQVVHSFASYGHSGGSAAGTIPVIMQLLERKNLTPLTDDPEEWVKIDEKLLGNPRKFPNLWQNCRLTEAFSHDGGKTYYLLSEGGTDEHPYPKHKTADHKSLAKT